MSPANSWDCYGRFSNYPVFQLQRHADHHSYPTRRFATLKKAAKAAKLPVDPLLIAVAMVPPLWRRTMNPRVRTAEDESRQYYCPAGMRREVQFRGTPRLGTLDMESPSLISLPEK